MGPAGEDGVLRAASWPHCFLTGRVTPKARSSVIRLPFHCAPYTNPQSHSGEPLASQSPPPSKVVCGM